MRKHRSPRQAAEGVHPAASSPRLLPGGRDWFSPASPRNAGPLDGCEGRSQACSGPGPFGRSSGSTPSFQEKTLPESGEGEARGGYSRRRGRQGAASARGAGEAGDRRLSVEMGVRCRGRAHGTDAPLTHLCALGQSSHRRFGLCLFQVVSLGCGLAWLGWGLRAWRYARPELGSLWQACRVWRWAQQDQGAACPVGRGGACTGPCPPCGGRCFGVGGGGRAEFLGELVPSPFVPSAGTVQADFREPSTGRASETWRYLRI